VHLIYKFHLDDFPSIREWILHLISISNEHGYIVDSKYKSCLDVSLHVDLDSNENHKDTNDLVGQHMLVSFFTLQDIDQR
jgi:hypothetical protein